MITTKQALDNAILAGVAYSNSLNIPMTTSNYGQNNSILIAQGLTPSQANAFATRYEVSYTFKDSATGFNATLFRDKTTGSYTIATAGTNPSSFKDGVNDVMIMVTGNPYEQTVAMDAFYRRISTPVEQGGLGIISPTTQFALADHSLGGGVNLAFANKHPDVVEHMYNFNAPGVGGVGAEVLDRLGILPNSYPSSKITNIIADEGPDIVAGLGVTYGETIRVPVGSWSHFQSDMINALQKAVDNNEDIYSLAQKQPTYSINIEKSVSEKDASDSTTKSTTADNTDGAYVASVSAYGKGSNSSAYNETIDQIEARYKDNAAKDSTATPQESVSEAGGVELTYAQLKSLSSYADKNNISLENTFQNIKQESNQAVSYINTDGNKISVSPEGNYTITTTSDEGVTQYFAYTKDSALLYKSSSVTLSDGSTLTKVFDADGKLTTTELTKIDTVGNKTTTITDVTKGTTTIMSVGDDGSVNEYEVPNSKPLESSMPDIDIAKFMDEQLSRFDKEDTTNIKEQGHYANSGAIKSDGTSGGGNTSTDTPNTDTTLSNTLTPSQYSSLSEFMNSKGDVDLTPANVGGSIVFKDIDGNTVSELHVDDLGIAKYTDSSGNSTFITEQGQTLNSDEYIRYRGEQALGVVNLANSFIGLQNWANETSLQKVAALASIYNQIDHLGSVTGASTDNLPGELGGVVAGLGLAMAIESGDTVGIVTSGLVFAEAVSGGAISSALGGTPVSTVVGAINMVNALQHGDTVGAISSGLMAIAPYCGVYAPVVMIAAIAISAIFGGGETPNLPMSEGHAHAIWDESSNTISVITDQDSHNGGPTANGWMSNMLSSVQTYLAGQVDTSGNPAYELIPARLPSIGFIYDPDGFNYSSATGHLTLTWTDENGASQTRYYNGQGSRMDGTSVEGMSDIMRDFLEHVTEAIVPSWEAATMREHWEATLKESGRAAADAQAAAKVDSSLPKETSDGLKEELHALVFEIPSETFSPSIEQMRLIDIDGDGYYENTQWIGADTATITIDANNNGIVDAGEIINLGEGSNARNSLDWLDANGDNILDANDPAFTALKVWLDVNSDGVSFSTNIDGSTNNETTGFSSLGITAIDFSSNPPKLVFEDSSAINLTEQILTGDAKGVRYTQTPNGLLEAVEDGETVLYAVNSREYDGATGASRGGDEARGNTQTIDKGDSRLTSYKTFTAANTLTQEVRSVTENMIKSASGGDSGLFGLSARLPLFIVGSGITATTLSAQTDIGETDTTQYQSISTTQNANSDSIFNIGDISKNTVIAEDTILRFKIDDLLRANSSTNQQTNTGFLSIVDSSNGTATIDGDEIVFTPNANYNGEAGFVYSIADDKGVETKAAVGISFAPINNTPIVNHELVMGKRNINYIITVEALLDNDTDIETPESISIVRIQNVQHGEAIFDGKSIKFIPETDYPGLGSFEYVVRDKHGGESIGVAQIDLSHININPIATDDSFDGYEDTPFIISQEQLIANDSDPDAWQFSHLSVDAVRNATHGSVSIQADGSIRYAPDANYNGTASFEYRLSDNEGGYTWATAVLNIQAVNDAPIIEDVLYGRPIYGYRWEADVKTTLYTDDSGNQSKDVTWRLQPVLSQAEAQSLISNPNDKIEIHTGKYQFIWGPPFRTQEIIESRPLDLLDSSGNKLTPSYYPSGINLRPIGFDYNDATMSGDEYSSSYKYNDPYRQNGVIIAYDVDSPQSSLAYSISGSPVHGHAWANTYISANEQGSIPYTDVLSKHWLSEKGAYQYYSHYGDSYSGVDAFTVRVTDDQGAYGEATATPYHAGTTIPGGGGGKKPVSLDLTGNGLSFLDMDDSSVYFDVNGDDWREHIAWVSPDDGLLALDINGDRVIKSIEEISFVGYKEGARTDLEGLQAFDSNHDNVLSKLDERWGSFGVWQDKNSNGISETGEFTTLDERGIASINLTSDNNLQQIGDTTLFGVASYTTTDGTTYAVGDVAFKYDANDKLPTDEALKLTDAETAKMIQMAALFNQMIATSNSPNTEPLGYIQSEEINIDIQIQETMYTENKGVSL